MYLKLWKKLSLLVACQLFALTAPALDTTSLSKEPASIKVVMGDGKVNGELIQAYKLTWSQCNFQNDQWVSSPPFQEAAVINDNETISIVQTNSDINGTRSVATHNLDHKSLKRSRLERKISDASGKLLGETSTTFTPQGSTTVITQCEQTKTTTSKINSTMYSGMFLGLPLSTLDYSKGSYIMEASMMSFQGTYRIEATHVGRETLEVADQQLTADLIDVQWLHHESGDVYPAGPNASGGRYWLLKNPPLGVPHVIAYKTDTYAIEFVPMTCS